VFSIHNDLDVSSYIPENTAKCNFLQG